MNTQSLQKSYTRIIGIFFVLVFITLIIDYLKFGYRLETWHKIFHVLLGAIVLHYGWNNQKFWKPFALVNGIFFTLVALIGIIFPDFYGLDAFNRLDTILHGIVGVSGLVIGLLNNKKAKNFKTSHNQLPICRNFLRLMIWM